MPASALATIQALEESRRGNWFPAKFPAQQLLAEFAPRGTIGRDLGLRPPLACEQKKALLLRSLNKKQVEACQQTTAESVDMTRLANMHGILSGDQQFLLSQALMADQVEQASRKATVDPSLHTCVHMWIENSGIGSEINNLISAAVYCEQHGLACVVEDRQWNAGSLGDYLMTEPIIYTGGCCPRLAGRCRPLEVRRQARVATPGWFGVCQHAQTVPLAVKAECTQRLWKYSESTAKAIRLFNRELALPPGYAAVHIRRGDKVTGPGGRRGNEALPIPTSTYVHRMLEQLNILGDACKVVAVCTDDVSAAQEFAVLLQQARPGLEVRWRKRTNTPERLRHGHWQGAWNDMPLSERQTFTHEFLADVEVMRSARLLLCTYSSNASRLVALLRHGTDSVTVSLDEAWTNS